MSNEAARPLSRRWFQRNGWLQLTIRLAVVAVLASLTIVIFGD